MFQKAKLTDFTSSLINYLYAFTLQINEVESLIRSCSFKQQLPKGMQLMILDEIKATEKLC